MARLKAMDLWSNPKFAEDLINSYEKADETRAKEKRNDIESFFYEMHGTNSKKTGKILIRQPLRKKTEEDRRNRIKGV